MKEKSDGKKLSCTESDIEDCEITHHSDVQYIETENNEEDTEIAEEQEAINHRQELTGDA